MLKYCPMTSSLLNPAVYQLPLACPSHPYPVCTYLPSHLPPALPSTGKKSKGRVTKASGSQSIFHPKPASVCFAPLKRYNALHLQPGPPSLPLKDTQPPGTSECSLTKREPQHNTANSTGGLKSPSSNNKPTSSLLHLLFKDAGCQETAG